MVTKGRNSSILGLVAWITTPVFLVAFGIILLAFDPLQRIALRVGRRSHEQVVVALNRCLVYALRLTGMRLEVTESTAACAGGPLVVLSNHQSLFDIPILHTLFRHLYPRFVSKVELARGIPSVSFNLREGENGVIDRASRTQAIRELRRLAGVVRARKVAVVIFPEGTRARDGIMRRFKPAGVHALLQSLGPCTVVPVAIDGTWRLAAHKLWPIPFGCTVRIKVGEARFLRSESEIGEVVRDAEQFVAAAVNAPWRSSPRGDFLEERSPGSKSHRLVAAISHGTAPRDGESSQRAG